MTDNVEQKAPEIRVGFENALLKVDPNWRTNMSPEQVNVFRHFYGSAVNDALIFIQVEQQSRVNNMQFLVNNVNSVGREEEIAAAQKAMLDAQVAEQKKANKPAKAVKPTKKVAAKPTTKPKAKEVAFKAPKQGKK